MLNEVLYFGYNPSCERSELFSTIQECANEKKHESERSELIEMGQEALQDAINSEIQNVGTDVDYILPLSSGLDSRSILGYLLSHPEIKPEQILTISFGTPNTWDYEIGQRIAAEVGVENEAIDLTADSFDWSIDQLQSYAQKLDCPVPIFEGYINNVSVIDNCSSNAIIWSGFLGEATAGAHLPKEPTCDWNTAKQRFLKSNQASNQLISNDFSPISSLPDNPYFSNNLLQYYDQLDFAHRQQCFIAPLVLSEAERYVTPFIRPEWLSFSLNLPNRYRLDRNLFKGMMIDRFPELFAIPTDENYGLSLNDNRAKQFMYSIHNQLLKKIHSLLSWEYTSKKTNYVNFASMFRKKGQLATTAQILIDSFEERDIAPWIDARDLWERHQTGKNFAREIRIICSLELYYSSR